MAIPHPFYPINASIPHYVPSTHSTVEILVPFFSIVFTVLGVASFLISSRKISLTTSVKTTRAIFVWFTLCGFIHLIVEGYYAFNSRTIAGQETFMADMWKEYALSDSRYMSIDSFVWMMESITAFIWGPLSFYTAFLIYSDSSSRHLFQFIVSFGQV